MNALYEVMPQQYRVAESSSSKTQVLRYKSHSRWFTTAHGIQCPYVLQSIQVYGLQFELKAKAGRVNQEQAQQSTNAAVNIR